MTACGLQRPLARAPFRRWRPVRENSREEAIEWAWCQNTLGLVSRNIPQGGQNMHKLYPTVIATAVLLILCSELHIRMCYTTQVFCAIRF